MIPRASSVAARLKREAGGLLLLSPPWYRRNLLPVSCARYSFLNDPCLNTSMYAGSSHREFMTETEMSQPSNRRFKDR